MKANWLTAEEIGERYVVGAGRLEAYAARGNLACRRPVGGPVLFDEAGVARFFRSRRAGIVVMRPHEGEHLGVLGVAKLGDAPTLGHAAPAGVRHRRVTRSDVAPTFSGAAPADVLPFVRKRA